MVRRREKQIRRSGWRRLLRWLCMLSLLVVILGVLVFVFAEQLANTSLAKRVLLNELKKRTGLEWSLERVTIDLPWQAGIQGLEIQNQQATDESVFSVQEINLTVQKHPRKLSLWPRRLEISEPHGVIPIQLIAELAKNPNVGWKEEPAPTVPQTSPTPLPVNPSKKEKSSLPDSVTPLPQKPKIPPPAKVKRLPVGPAVDIVLIGGDFTIIDNRDQSDIWQIKDVNMTIPLGGEDRGGEIEWASLALLGRDQPGSGEIDLQWTRPWLKVNELNGSFLDLDYRLVARVTPHNGGVVNGALEIPDQSWAFPDLGVSVGQLRGNSRFGGVFRNRATWRAASGFIVKDILVTDPRDGETIQFYEGKASVSSNAYAISLDDGILLGETVMLRGNAVFLRNGAVGAVLRLLTGPSGTESMNRLASQLEFSGDAPWMASSPSLDLGMRDIRVTGQGRQLWINVQGENEWVELRECLSALRSSKKTTIESVKP